MFDNHYISNYNLSNTVVDYIITKIFTCEYKAGDKIIERKISEELNISRAPIREAIQVLDQQGLIDCYPRKGCFVAFKTPAQIKEVFDIRCLLENDIIETLINENILTEEDYSNLYLIIAEMDKIAKSDNTISEKVFNMSKEDIKFHQYLWKKSNKSLYIQILNNMFLSLQLAMIVDTNLNPNLDSTPHEHEVIVDALKNKNISKSKEYLRAHIISYRNNII